MVREGTAGEAGASSLAIALKDSPVRVDRWTLDGAGAPGAEGLLERLGPDPAPEIVLWLGASDLEALVAPLTQAGEDTRICLSSTLLGGSTGSVPVALRPRAALAHPFCLPEDFELRFSRASVWLSGKGLPLVDPRLEAQTSFACMLLGEALLRVRYDYYYRDFLLETLEHMPPRVGISCATHPALSFGPGQRLLSKGCYTVTFPDAKDPGRVSASWVVP